MQSAVNTRPGFRSPQRISITVADHVYRQLVERSNREGRSISNLAAFLLEHGLNEILEADADSGSAGSDAKDALAPNSSVQTVKAMHWR